MKILMTTGSVTAAVLGVVMVTGTAFAANQSPLPSPGIDTQQRHMSAEIRIAENHGKDGKDHKHMDGKHEGHMEGDEHKHKEGEAAHHGEEGHKHKEGDEHAHKKGEHDDHEEHMKKGSDDK